MLMDLISHTRFGLYEAIISGANWFNDVSSPEEGLWRRQVIEPCTNISHH
jgi:hypothetical protein